MTTNGPIWRAIESHSTRMNPGSEKSWAVGGSITLVFAGCGHSYPRKLSAGVPKRARCRECESLRNGAIYTTTHSNGTETVQTWDAATGLPNRVTQLSRPD